MKTFLKKVDTRSRKAMADYLSGHFRYHTANSWNGSTSYAHDMKIYNLGLTSEIQGKLYEFMECEDFYRLIDGCIADFGQRHGYKWQAGFNGRQGGYLVLYQGDKYESGQAYSTPGKSTDQREDFSEWGMEELRGRVGLVQEFDRLAEGILHMAANMAKIYRVADEEYTVTRTRKVLEEIPA